MSIHKLGPKTRADEPITLFKCVTRSYYSQYLPHKRTPLESLADFDRGTHLEYPLNSQVQSPGGPGIMGYASLDGRHEYSPFVNFISPTYRWLVLIAPYGATICRGVDDNGHEIICANVVDVVGEIKVDFGPRR